MKTIEKTNTSDGKSEGMTTGSQERMPDSDIAAWREERKKSLEERQRESLPHVTYDEYVKDRKRRYDEWITFRKPGIPSEYTPYLKGIELKEWIYKDTCHRKTMEKIPYYVGMAAAIISILSLTVSLRQGRRRK